MKKVFSSIAKKKILAICLFSIIGLCQPNLVNAKEKGCKVTVSADEDAKIFVNGKLVGNGATEIIVPPDGSANVRVEKVGYVAKERNYINDNQHVLPRSEFIKLRKDQAYASSVSTATANQDIEIKTNMSEDAAWKLMTKIITNTFDVIQLTDKNTGYMYTAWVVRKIDNYTIRTRMIIKPGSSDQLYKAKLVSEIAYGDIPVLEDEHFEPWDRVLRTYENVISELQGRMERNISKL